MHGRPRPVPGQAVDPEKAKAAKQRLALLTRLNEEVLTRRSAAPDPTSLTLAATLLEHNPEAYTAWNFRREALGGALAAGGADGVAAAEAELALTEKALRRNPKSYAAWHARRWVVGYRLTSLAAEVRLVDALLDLDARNFHAWAYRGWVCDLAGVPAGEQLAATGKRIEADFSNYSAWHARSALLVRVVQAGGGGDGAGGGGGDAPPPPTTLNALLSGEGGQGAPMGGDEGAAPTPTSTSAHAPTILPPAVLAAECALVRSATFTDPTDQAAWFYHRWLVGHVVAGARAAVGRQATTTSAEKEAAVAAADAALAADVAACEELLAAEPDRTLCKWPLLAQAHLADARAGLAGLVEREKRGGGAAPPAAGDGGKTRLTAAAPLYAELEELDPMRRAFYRDASAGVAAVAVPEV